MLQLKGIKKNYAEGAGAVRALQGVDLEFRKSEFVCVLGPSGCGKTTMLNIIGGLDQYTEGDLRIDGVSTKDYKDRDWDTYRNHSVGFVFQNYHLIPHQSVLQNVELALSLSGVPRKERRRRAKEALEQVGLHDQLKKRPSEMSGGQMQRVAIARALVNNPDIILADEPTGALDTQTSQQVMDILKEISKDRLVIMVTHNPDLADRYATRIIRMLDGRITGDTAPLSDDERAELTAQDTLALEKRGRKREKKPSLSFWTSFNLSLKNLFTKKGRTVLTSFAGSIGIIGIALIFAVSQGTTTYIDSVQEDALSSYPLTIEASTVDLSTLMQTFMGAASNTGESHDKDAVYSQSVMYDMMNALNNIESMENDLRTFKSYIEEQMEKKDGEVPLRDALTGVRYTYNLDLLIYTKGVDGNILRSDTQELLQQAISDNMGMDMSAMVSMGENMMGGSAMTSMMPMGQLWCEILEGKDGEIINDLVKTQYDKVYGQWPQAYNEVMLVLDENNELDDITLYALGLESKEMIDSVFEAVQSGEQIDATQKRWTYEDVCSQEYRIILNSQCYTLDENTGLYVDLRDTDAGLRYLYDNGIPLKISGVIRPNPDATTGMLTGSIAYTRDMTEYIVAQTGESAALQAQLADEKTDIFSGLPFRPAEDTLDDAGKQAAFIAYAESLSQKEKAQAYIRILSLPTQEQLDAAVEQNLGGMQRFEIEELLVQTLRQQMGMDEQQLRSYVKDMTDAELEDILRQMIEEQVRSQMAAQVLQQTAQMTEQQLAGALDAALPAYTQAQCAAYYDAIPQFSEKTLEENLKTLGSIDLDDPATINFYASSFENKDILEDVIRQYNENVDDLHQIRYTDYVGLMMSSVTTIIDAITYVLIAFVAISLVVSSIMIGVITLISVQERTKEIGILRAIGASKRNVSSMFNAETMIIGLSSGLLGVGVTYLLCLPINAIIQSLTGISNLRAILPVNVAAILVGISVLLTLISGIIPSRSAAKKDPVVALRTE